MFIYAADIDLSSCTNSMRVCFGGVSTSQPCRNRKAFRCQGILKAISMGPSISLSSSFSSASRKDLGPCMSLLESLFPAEFHLTISWERLGYSCQLGCLPVLWAEEACTARRDCHSSESGDISALCSSIHIFRPTNELHRPLLYLRNSSIAAPALQTLQEEAISNIITTVVDFVAGMPKSDTTLHNNWKRNCYI